MEKITELKRRIAQLETRLDLAESELSHLHFLLVECGFPSGIASLKATINELLSESKDRPDDPPCVWV